jgi:hypothetical protein
MYGLFNFIRRSSDDVSSDGRVLGKKNRLNRSWNKAVVF